MTTHKEITVYSPEEFERDFAGEADEMLPNLAMRPAPVPAYFKQDRYEEFGCQMIDSLFLLLDWLACPSRLRPIVVVVSGLSGGNYERFTEVPQVKIGKRLGCTTDTVRNLLEELAEWEWKNDRTMIQIEEQERDPASRRFNTTKYRPIIVYYAAEFIRRIKARGIRPVHQQQAVKEHTEKIIGQIQSELAEEMPTAPPLKARQERNAAPPQQKLSFIEGIERQVLSGATRWREVVRQQPGYYSKKDPDIYEQYVEEFVTKIRVALLAE